VRNCRSQDPEPDNGKGCQWFLGRFMGSKETRRANKKGIAKKKRSMGPPENGNPHLGDRGVSNNAVELERVFYRSEKQKERGTVVAGFKGEA